MRGSDSGGAIREASLHFHVMKSHVDDLIPSAEIDHYARYPAPIVGRPSLLPLVAQANVFCLLNRHVLLTTAVRGYMRILQMLFGFCKTNFLRVVHSPEPRLWE